MARTKNTAKILRALGIQADTSSSEDDMRIKVRLLGVLWRMRLGLMV
ncbi:hypothetical protein PC129_g20472 [Phytophthora cactorum]|uniref:Uncharacterized protein n=1 Tax=Phytophthora cactorum TaxID=29920 RepID=A0A329S793_9STRA|nr:hypothetical protein Pcac1_g27434 [Phytophthora cactorum]KAG2800187.1 hypothetical protein PC112_g20589 [Phytophthora cactorum]KAG2800417.1 hypothetical protein PC111_g19985 [Phytophthora cactorum]KAG2887731.1 hypothetical protein PC115_g20258 [Phytophthora cactorum]KAG2898513.1 hypothetical protein PC117_g22504 [Phytophthora cactorum]